MSWLAFSGADSLVRALVAILEVDRRAVTVRISNIQISSAADILQFELFTLHFCF